MDQVLNLRINLKSIIFCLTALQLATFGQNCPADLEWPTSSQAGPGTTNVNAVVVWPTSLETKSIITDRHPNARLPFVTPTTYPPAFGTTLCDPAFKTSITRLTPEGYSLTYDSFSAAGGWILSIGPGGGAVAIALDTTTGRPQTVAGQIRQISLTYELLPQSASGGICPVSSAFWSKKEEGVVFMVGCGTRIFKYNLALYNSARPSAGLVAGSNPRSIAKWPTCSNCRQGPVFMNFDDLFGAHSNNGNIGSLAVSVNADDTTFTGFMTRHEAYKNVKGIMVYRPLTNSLWYSAGSSQPFLLTGKFNGAAINRRIIGTQTELGGRYLTIAACADAVYDLWNCSTADSYYYDLNTVPTGPNLISINPTGLDQLSHGAVGTSLRIGANGITQSLAISYFSGTPEKKLLALPNMIGPEGWWGSYTDTGTINGPSGDPLASAYSTYSYEKIGGTPIPRSACPARWCLYGNELFLFNSSGTRFLRIGHNQSRIEDYNVSAYWDLPRVSLSQDGKFVAFVSNWGTSSTAAAVKSAVYMVRVPAAWRMLLDDTVTVNATASAIQVNTPTTLTVSHASWASGANVLLQDASQVSAVKATACMLQVTKSKMIQLANDSGSFLNRYSGPIGSPSAGVLENSRCRIDIAKSTIDATTHGNIIYKLNITYKAPFVGKAIRAIIQLMGTSTWTDGTKFDVKTTVLSWALAPGGRSAAEVEEEAAVTRLERSNDPLLPGSSLKFPLEDPQPFQLNLTDDFVTVTLRVSRTEEGVPQFEVLQDSTQLAVLPEVKGGSLVRVDYREDGRLTILVDGSEIAIANGPASRAGLYLVTDRINSQARIVTAEQ